MYTMSRYVLNTKIIQALISKYDAQYKEADATLSIYMQNSVGIGEHPQHLEEMDKLVNAMVQANDNKEMITKWQKENLQ